MRVQCHGQSSRHAGHGKKREAQKRHNKTNSGAILPATDQGAEEHRQVHGQQHVADLLDLPGEKGQHQTNGQEHSRQQQVSQ